MESKGSFFTAAALAPTRVIFGLASQIVEVAGIIGATKEMPRETIAEEIPQSQSKKIEPTRNSPSPKPEIFRENKLQDSLPQNSDALSKENSQDDQSEDEHSSDCEGSAHYSPTTLSEDEQDAQPEDMSPETRSTMRSPSPGRPASREPSPEKLKPTVSEPKTMPDGSHNKPKPSPKNPSAKEAEAKPTVTEPRMSMGSKLLASLTAVAVAITAVRYALQKSDKDDSARHTDDEDDGDNEREHDET